MPKEGSRSKNKNNLNYFDMKHHYPDKCKCNGTTTILGNWTLCREHGWTIERPRPVQLSLFDEFEGISF
jgi:hypothetical protein